MALHPDREPFIPIRVQDLIDLLCDDRGPGGATPLAEADRAAFRQFAAAAAAHVHSGYLGQISRLKTDYAPFDPDNELKELRPIAETDRPALLDELFERFAALFQKANFKRLTRDELDRIMLGASAWGVDMHVPWDAYEKVDLYVRGLGTGRREMRKWYRFFRKQQVTVPTYSRVVLILKQRPHKAIGRDADTRNVFLKLFKDIPTMDLEMLLPGTRIKMPLLDRLRLSGSGLGSFGYVVFKLSSLSVKGLTAALFGGGLLGLVTLYTPLALILGYAYKTYASFSTTKQSYMLQLSQSLYFQNLDNNAGVLHRLLDAAEEQETREVLLAYFFLWRYAGARGWTAEDLDHYIELELGRQLDREIDFEVIDAVRKLEAAGVIERTGDRLKALPIHDALNRLDDMWAKPAQRVSQRG